MRTGQLLDFQVFEMALRAFGFQRQVTFAWLTVAQAGDDMTVDSQLDYAVGRLDTVVVPFVGTLAEVARRQTAGPAVGVRAIRNTTRSPDAEEIALACGDGFALLVLVGEVHKHLDLNAARVAGANGWKRIGPDKKATVADGARCGRHVHPIEFRDEILILLRRAQIACRPAGRDDLPILDIKRVGGTVHIDPAVQAVAVKEWSEAFVLVAGVHRKGKAQTQDDGDKAAVEFRVHTSINLGKHNSNRQPFGRARQA